MKDNVKDNVKQDKQQPKNETAKEPTKNKNKFAGKVSADAKHNKQKRIQHIKSLYVKTNEITFKESPNMKAFRAITKDFCTAELSLSAKAIYPVLCMLSNFENKQPIQISIENIGIYSGIKSWRTVSKALEQLKAEKWIKGEKVERQRKYWVYKVKFLKRKDLEKDSEEREKFFPLHTCIIESGIWARLTNRAKVLYLYLRTVSKYNYEQDGVNIGISYDEAFKNREFEVFYGKLNNLKQAGISAKNISEDIKKLKEVKLISIIDHTRTGEYCLEVYLRPRKIEVENNFELFWQMYPRKVTKQACRKLWIRIFTRHDKPTWQTIKKALEIQKNSASWTDENYIPYPKNWLIDRRWEDDPKAYTQSNKAYRKSVMPKSSANFDPDSQLNKRYKQRTK